ncbi:hypothetical protein BSQ97_20645 [Serratia proteamaculans]|nr:DUF637 domain-containing protein [Serratia proteamaculans]RYM49321.1 hypothetical protein BSQ97_20645 [Serratia proteamaculans]
MPQHAAGQSVISSSLNTAINGGSFKDNLTNALLANIGSQINAEGAKLIGDNGEVLGVADNLMSLAMLNDYRCCHTSKHCGISRRTAWCYCK